MIHDDLTWWKKHISTRKKYLERRNQKEAIWTISVKCILSLEYQIEAKIPTICVPMATICQDTNRLKVFQIGGDINIREHAQKLLFLVHEETFLRAFPHPSRKTIWKRSVSSNGRISTLVARRSYNVTFRYSVGGFVYTVRVTTPEAKICMCSTTSRGHTSKFQISQMFTRKIISSMLELFGIMSIKCAWNIFYFCTPGRIRITSNSLCRSTLILPEPFFARYHNILLKKLRTMKPPGHRYNR